MIIPVDGDLSKVKILFFSRIGNPCNGLELKEVSISKKKQAFSSLIPSNLPFFSFFV